MSPSGCITWKAQSLPGNAITLLDMYALGFPQNIERTLERISTLNQPYIKRRETKSGMSKARMAVGRVQVADSPLDLHVQHRQPPTAQVNRSEASSTSHVEAP
ncbi:MAG: hypothetical protein ACI9TH_000283 [Kiritimatiellia bacterium]|jgi:hypothetical protein